MGDGDHRRPRGRAQRLVVKLHHAILDGVSARRCSGRSLIWAAPAGGRSAGGVLGAGTGADGAALVNARDRCSGSRSWPRCRDCQPSLRVVTELAEHHRRLVSGGPLLLRRLSTRRGLRSTDRCRRGGASGWRAFVGGGEAGRKSLRRDRQRRGARHRRRSAEEPSRERGETLDVVAGRDGARFYEGARAGARRSRMARHSGTRCRRCWSRWRRRSTILSSVCIAVSESSRVPRRGPTFSAGGSSTTGRS